jgi:hypothetical protein
VLCLNGKDSDSLELRFRDYNTYRPPPNVVLPRPYLCAGPKSHYIVLAGEHVAEEVKAYVVEGKLVPKLPTDLNLSVEALMTPISNPGTNLRVPLAHLAELVSSNFQIKDLKVPAPEPGTEPIHFLALGKIIS